MRTRARFKSLNLTWILLALAQIALAAARIDHNIHRGRDGWGTVDIISITLWAFILTAYIFSVFLDFWQVDPTGIRYRKMFNTRDIPFTSVAAIRPTGSSCGSLEIEVARLGIDIYPHQYLVANPADCEAFLETIKHYAPKILIEA